MAQWLILECAQAFQLTANSQFGVREASHAKHLGRAAAVLPPWSQAASSSARPLPDRCVGQLGSAPVLTGLTRVLHRRSPVQQAGARECSHQRSKSFEQAYTLAGASRMEAGPSSSAEENGTLAPLQPPPIRAFPVIGDNPGPRSVGTVWLRSQMPDGTRLVLPARWPPMASCLLPSTGAATR